MARPMRDVPRRVSTAVQEALTSQEPPERDQCGLCGGWYVPGPDDLSGVCPADRGQAYNGLADSAGPWE